MKIKIPKSQKEITKIITELCQRSILKEALVRITLTRGSYNFSLSIHQNQEPTLIITVTPININSKIYKGVKILTHQDYYERIIYNNTSLKTNYYVSSILAKNKAETKDYYDALLVNKKNIIKELTTANFFCIKNNQLITPNLKSGILDGITRKKVLNLNSGLIHKEKSISIEEIPSFEEAFLTSSIRGIVPITQINKILINNGKVGKWTSKIRELYLTETRNIL